MRLKFLIAVVALASVALVSTITVAGDEQAGYFAKSVELETKGKYQEALDALEKVTDGRRTGYIFHLRKGWLLYLLGKYVDSVKSYEAAIAKEPASVEAMLGIMQPQLATRRWVDVERMALKVLKLDPMNYLANSRLAYALYTVTRFHDAQKAYKKVVDHYPGDVEMRSGYGWSLFKQGKYEEAKVQFKKILDIAPTHAAALEGMKYCP